MCTLGNSLLTDLFIGKLLHPNLDHYLQLHKINICIYLRQTIYSAFQDVFLATLRCDMVAT